MTWDLCEPQQTDSCVWELAQFFVLISSPQNCLQQNQSRFILNQLWVCSSTSDYYITITSGLFCKGLPAIPRLILASQNSGQTTASSSSDLTKIFIIVQQGWCFAGTIATLFCVSSIPHNASKAQPDDALVRESSDLTLAKVHFLYWKFGGKQIN